MIQGKLFSYGDDFSDIFNIRRKVFIEEMGIPENIEFDDLENEAIHVLVYESTSNSKLNDFEIQKKPVATGRIIYKGDSCQIGHVAVLKEYRKLLYGDFTVKMLINRAFTAGINKVTLISKPEVEEFFRKIGFETADFDEVNNEVYMIIKKNHVKRACAGKYIL
jgi:N-acetylglutamate synthase-like GNAT family acetyltransferase